LNSLRRDQDIAPYFLSKRSVIDIAMDFHIGQHVICICDKWSNEPTWRAAVHTFPKLGGIYAIRDICDREGLIGLMFEEIWHKRAMFCVDLVEPAFNAKRFRPVKKSSIDVFKKMLEPAPKVRVDA
jgi:hypothetical protein